MSKVIVSSDFFLEEVRGGAEFYNEELLQALAKDHDVIAIKSEHLSIDFFKQHKDAFFIVSNFVLLSEAVKQCLINDDVRYCILEHNPAWNKQDNPLRYPKSIVPEDQLQHVEFYKNAEAILCQSQLHADLTRKNLLLNNVVNLGCNLWREETLQLLEKNIDTEKTRKVGIMESQNKNKGFPQAVNYCRSNDIEFDAIPFLTQENFFSELAKTETLVLFPQWLETFCRVAVEARVLGCKLITNKALGCASEPFFKLKGKELLDEIRRRREGVLEVYEKLIAGQTVETVSPPLQLPKVTLISTFYNADEYIDGHLKNIREQTIFDDLEIIFVDPASPGKDKQKVDGFVSEFSNATLIESEKRITTAEAFNLALQFSKGDLVVFACTDDRMAKDYLETARKHLFLDEDVDLVYGDCLQTTKPNETVEQNSSRGRLYEHSRMKFSPENMIKSLPGPMPAFRKSMIEKHGSFKDELKFASDWELWLRCVRGGSKFKKIDKVVGLYYYNKDGLSTSPENAVPRLKEEAQVFNEYKDVIGEKNYNTFKDYFNQAL